jgi:hypothetical protein
LSESNQLPELREFPSSPDAASKFPAESATATAIVIASGIASNAFGAPDSQSVALLSLLAEGERINKKER